MPRLSELMVHNFLGTTQVWGWASVVNRSLWREAGEGARGPSNRLTSFRVEANRVRSEVSRYPTIRSLKLSGSGSNNHQAAVATIIRQR